MEHNWEAFVRAVREDPAGAGFVLDFDGTLSGIAPTPAEARAAFLAPPVDRVDRPAQRAGSADDERQGAAHDLTQLGHGVLVGRIGHGDGELAP